MATLLLLDGNSLTYRAFFALPADLTTASGQVTNAVFGFTSMLINLLRDQKPDAVAVCFDLPEPTFRHEANAEYKANRSAAPDVLRQQMGLVRQVVESLGITHFEASAPRQVYKAGKELAVLVPTRMRLQAPDGKFVKDDYILGISDDAGKTWKFSNLSYLEMSEIRRLFPRLPASLVLPPRAQFVEDVPAGAPAAFSSTKANFKVAYPKGWKRATRRASASLALTGRVS